MIKKQILLFLIVSFTLLTGCTATQINASPSPGIHPADRIVVLPFANHTETPQAGDRAMTITAALLEAKGVPNVVVYQMPRNTKSLFPGIVPPPPAKTLLGWARAQGANYVLTGSVNEWTYKVGLDGEPVVGVTLQLLSPYSGEILWTAAGSMSGGSRVAVSTVAQSLISRMLNYLLLTNTY